MKSYDNAENAMLLERFIKYYKPTGWKETIQTCAFPPYINVADYLRMQLEYGSGRLESHLKSIPEFNKPYLIEAIQEYFKENKEIKK
jgi:hypothetical protein